MTAARARTVVVGIAVAAYAWWATGLATFSAASTVAIVGAGAAAVAWGTAQRFRRREVRAAARPAGRRGGAVWLGLLVVLTAWQAQAFVQSPREDHPTLSYLANAALGTHGARTVACFGWIVGAERLARREGREPCGR